LLDGIKDGTIDFITSDHNPLNIEHKNTEFEHARYGTIGLESAFGALNSILDTNTTIKLLTNGKIRYQIASYGIKEGEKAELSLFNPGFKYKFQKETIHSTSKNSAFLNISLKGKAYGIISNNQLVLND